jgi:hypothetical protein
VPTAPICEHLLWLHEPDLDGDRIRHNLLTVIYGEHYRACRGFCSPIPTVTIGSLA